MNKSKEYRQIEKKRFLPEIKNCTACGMKLKRHMTLSKKTIITLNGVVYATHIGYSCPNEKCIERRKVHRSAVADSLALPNFTFGMDIVALVGYLRLSKHYTVDEVHREINERIKPYTIQMSRRNVMYLFEAYCALLKASAKHTSDPEFHAWLKQIREKKHCIISIDGIQPDKGEDTVYLIREVTSGRLLHAQNVSSSDKNAMKDVLSQIRDLNLPITGFISDAQETIVTAISELWPDVPHQTCQFHYFQEAARPIFEEDRATRKEMRKKITPPLRSLRRQLAEEIAATHDEETEEAQNERKQLQILDTCALAAKSSLNRDGTLPFNYSGLKGYQDLDALEKSLDDMKKKASESGKKPSKKVARKLKRLQKIIASRKKWQEKMSQIEKMQKWVLDTEYILSGDFAGKDAVLTNQMVAEHFDQHIASLQAQFVSGENLTEIEKECLKHFIKTSLNLRQRLIICYDVLDLPRTDNDMEQSIRRIKTRYRRISGRKNWNAYLLRYGQSISYFDYYKQNGLDQDAFLKMFCCVSRKDWHDTRKFHRSIQSDRLNVFRFRHNQDAFLHQLQESWEQTLA